MAMTTTKELTQAQKLRLLADQYFEQVAPLENELRRLAKIINSKINADNAVEMYETIIAFITPRLPMPGTAQEIDPYNLEDYFTVSEIASAYGVTLDDINHALNQYGYQRLVLLPDGASEYRPNSKAGGHRILNGQTLWHRPVCAKLEALL